MFENREFSLGHIMRHCINNHELGRSGKKVSGRPFAAEGLPWGKGRAAAAGKEE
jgi:hypothetical protein